MQPVAATKAAVIAGLRARILGLERHAPRRGPSALPEAALSEETRPQTSFPEAAPRFPRKRRWELGCPPADALLPNGLEANAVHEIKGLPSAPGAASAADWMAAIGFAARLAVRRVEALSPTGMPGTSGTSSSPSAAPSWVLWCWPRALAQEFGAPSMAGLAHLGLDPSRLIIVETARAGDALNALEESLKTQSLAASLAIVVGVLDEVELTPARRLSLAAGETATPCLIVTHPASEPTGATATRWRIGRLGSAPHRFDPRAPGAVRFSAALERCRARPGNAARLPMLLEWCDETRRFALASLMADLPAETRRAQGSAAAPAVRAR